MIGIQGAGAELDAWVRWLDTAGEPIGGAWTIGDATTFDEARSGALLPDGGLLIVGQRDVGAGNYDAWATRLDAGGGEVFDKLYGGPDDDELLSAVALPGGGFVAVGYRDRVGDADFTPWLLRADSSGTPGCAPDEVCLPACDFAECGPATDSCGECGSCGPTEACVEASCE